VAGGLGWLKEARLGGAEAGRGGRGLGGGFDLDDGPRLREGGESKAVSMIGVVGEVSWGVVGVAGWRTIASLWVTSKGVSWFGLECLLEELAMPSSDMVREQETECEGCCEHDLYQNRNNGRSSVPWPL